MLTTMYKKTLQIPSEVQICKIGNILQCVGPLGSIEMNLQKIDRHGLSFIQLENSKLLHIYVKKTKMGAGILGTLESLCKNLILGVSQGFVLYLELVGVGYRASISGQDIEFKLGQSHELIYKVPEGMKPFLAKPTIIGLYGVNRAQVSQVAAEIRSLKSPEPYKGKGIRYKDEVILTKTGKKK